MISPVALFTFKRLKTLEKTLKSLDSNYLSEDTELYIFSDGPNQESESHKVDSVREYILNFSGFKKINLIKRESNYGLTKNIVEGINFVLSKYNSVIVLEDDIVTSKYFLTYMNKALKIYESNNKVCQISGYSYLEKYSKKYLLDDTYFIKGGDCMAWGTWKSSWDLYTDDANYLLTQIKRNNLKKDFNRNNSFNYFKMLSARAKNKNKSWAICWYAINFLLDKYTLYPLKTYAIHIGNDKEATNYIPKFNDALIVDVNNDEIDFSSKDVYEKESTRNAYEDFLKDLKGNIFDRLKCYIKVLKREFLNG